MGRVVGASPVIGSMLYNSVATGKYADKHGVLGLRDIDADGTIKRVDSHSRRTKAFWDILSQNDKTTHVVNFPATGPAEAINGTFVAPGLPSPDQYTGPIGLSETLVRSEHTATFA